MIKVHLAILFFVYSCSSSRMNESNIKNKIVYQTIEAPPPRPKSIIKTDSSIIETRYHEDLNSISEFNELNSSDDYHYTEYRFTNKTIIKKGFVKDGRYSGIWKYYDERGQLQKEINFDSGEKKLLNGNKEPYDELFIEMKLKADNLLIDHFGKDFFSTNLKWNIYDSHFFSTNNSGSWFEIPEEKPEQFRFSYSVLFDNNYKLASIEFTLDSKGKMVDSLESKGLSKCDAAPCAFSLDYLRAIQIAKQNGIEPGEDPEHFYLKWSKYPNSYLGDYQLIILQLKEKKQYNKRVSYYYYDGIVINPWNGQVIRKSEFYEMYSRTINCHYSSGIMERENKSALKAVFETIYNQSLFVLYVTLIVITYFQANSHSAY